jgi:hypothetical protein
MSSPRSEQIVISGGLEYEVEEGDEGKKAEFMVATLLAPPRGAGTNNQCEQIGCWPNPFTDPFEVELLQTISGIILHILILIKSSTMQDKATPQYCKKKEEDDGSCCAQLFGPSGDDDAVGRADQHARRNGGPAAARQRRREG